MKKYSKSTRGFYDPAINPDIPSDAVTVSDEDYAALIAAQAEGMEIVPDDDGCPVAQTVTAVIVPVSVTPRQAKLALLSAGLLDDVEAAIEAIADATTKRVAQIEWEYAQEVRRDWPLLNAVAAQMGMTDAQIDELFTLAATL